MQRSVQPELLDGLPSEDPDAIGSRKDLVRINLLMGNWRWLHKQLVKHVDLKSAHLLEIGAGDGTLAKQLIKSLQPQSYAALDLASAPHNWPTSATWQQADLLRNADYTGATHLIANLVLHHFETDLLKSIGNQIQNSTIHTIIACEPCRRKLHQLQLGAGKLIGFNHVTLHDGHVSVEAGFRANELPELLGLHPSQWEWSITETFMGAYRMVANRK